MTYKEILDKLKTTALDEPEYGWLSGLSEFHMEYSDFGEEILLNQGNIGIIDLGQLAEIVEEMMSKCMCS